MKHCSIKFIAHRVAQMFSPHHRVEEKVGVWCSRASLCMDEELMYCVLTPYFEVNSN